MAPHPRFVGIRAGDHRKNNVFLIRGSEITAHSRGDVSFHPHAARLGQRQSGLSVSISDPFIGMGVNFANVTAAINLYRMRLPRGVSLILTVNAVIQMQRKVVVSQRLIVVLAIGNRQT